MTQLEAVTSYDRDELVSTTDEDVNGRDGWRQAFGAATERLVRGVNDANRQLSGAVEAFAAETLRLMEDLVNQAEAQASASARAAADAARAADEARSIADSAATSPNARLNIGPLDGADEVLERLEADYSLLSRLVDDLNARIASLAAPTPPAADADTPAAEAGPEPEDLATPPEASAPDTEASPATTDQQARLEPPAWPEDATPEQPSAALHLVATPPESEPELGDYLAENLTLVLLPVPDFDHLLNLDGALGRLPGVRNVTLVDYAHEQATFRIELSESVRPDDFVCQLADISRQDMTVTDVAPDRLALNIAPRT